MNKIITLPPEYIRLYTLEAKRLRMSVKALMEKKLMEAIDQERQERLNRIREYAGSWANMSTEELDDLLNARKGWKARNPELGV